MADNMTVNKSEIVSIIKLAFYYQSLFLQLISVTTEVINWNENNAFIRPIKVKHITTEKDDIAKRRNFEMIRKNEQGRRINESKEMEQEEHYFV